MVLHPLRQVPRAIAGLATLVAIGYGGRWIIDSLIAIFDMRWEDSGYGDCRVDWGAARLFLEHRSPYTEEGLRAIGVSFYGFGHPPTTAFWFIPFARIGYPLMSELLAVIVVAAVLAQVTLCVLELDLPLKIPIIALSTGWLLGTSWMIEHVHIVQVSEIIALLYTVAWCLLRRDRDVAAGAVLGFACTFKLYPGVLVLFLLLTRRFRAVFAACAAYLSVAAVMTRAFGVDAWRLFASQQAPMVQYWVGDVRNSSLVGIIAHLLKPLCRHPMMRTTWPEHQIRALPHTTPAPVLLGTVAAFVVLGVAWLACRRLARSRATIDVPFALFSALSPFLNVWVWEHYYVILIMPTFVVLAVLWVKARDIWVRTGTYSTLSSLRGEIVPALGCVGLALVPVALVFLLNIPMLKKEEIYGQYWALKNGHAPVPAALHLRLHWLEIANWLPWALVSVALAVIAARARAAVGASTRGPGVLPDLR